MIRTKYATIKDIKPSWQLIDVSGLILGRASVRVADILNGKLNPTFSPNQYSQAKVVVINTDLIKTTGNKLTDKVYYHHTGYPKGLRSQTLKKAMEKDSTWVFRKSVEGMLPKNKLRKLKMAGLFVYKDSNHKHMANFGKVSK